MPKTTLSVTIDDKVAAAARKSRINISQAAEDGIARAARFSLKPADRVAGLIAALTPEDITELTTIKKTGYTPRLGMLKGGARVPDLSRYLGVKLKKRGHKNVTDEDVTALIDRL